MRDVIKKKVILYKGFLSIFDEFFEEVGGIVYCEIGVDMLRNVK